ncbi:MAG: DNA repair protein RecO [Bacteroidota bacterium]
MLQKTKGIILHTTDYSETSLVVKAFTEDFGLQSYLINGVRKKNARVKSGLFQPLSQVELVAYHKEGGGLQRISEVRSRIQYASIPFDPVKSSMALFLNEMLFRSLKEGDGDAGLYGFISNALELLDLQSSVNSTFHFSFLIGLTRHLGFQPNGFYSDSTSYFDLLEGRFVGSVPVQPHYLDQEESRWLDQLLKSPLGGDNLPAMDSNLKRKLLERIIEYFRLHVAGFGEVRSHKVLEEVWS